MIEIDEKKILKITGIICIAIALCSLMLFMPSVQDKIILFGEKLAGKQLNYVVWKSRFVSYESFFLFSLFPFGCFVYFLIPFLKSLPAKNKNLCGIFVLILTILNVISIFSLYAHGLGWSDFYGQTRLCAYTLHGVNPFPIAGDSLAHIEKLGVVPQHFSTTPWGLLLGNIFYPGFLPLTASRIYFILLNFIAIISVAFSVHKKLAEKQTYVRFGIPMLALTSFTFWHALHQGNAGGIICCLIILAILWHNDFPVLSGIALAFAMVKPQISALVCLSFLLQRKYKPIFVAALIDIAAWLFVALIVRTSPVQLVRDFLSVATDSKTANNFKGIATILKGLISDSHILPLSMSIGIIFVLIFHFLLKNKQSSLYAFFPACIAAYFWSYSYGNDRFILFIPLMLAIFFLEDAKSAQKQVLWFFISVIFSLGSFRGVRTITRIFHLSFSPQQLEELVTTSYSILLIFISVIMLIKLNRAKGIAHETTTPRI